jgi:hypothetical protein
VILHQAVRHCIVCSYIAQLSWIDDDPEPDARCPDHPHQWMGGLRTIDTELDESNLITT